MGSDGPRGPDAEVTHTVVAFLASRGLCPSSAEAMPLSGGYVNMVMLVGSQPVRCVVKVYLDRSVPDPVGRFRRETMSMDLARPARRASPSRFCEYTGRGRIFRAKGDGGGVEEVQRGGTDSLHVVVSRVRLE